MNKQLKSCPFCGHKATLLSQPYQINQNKYFPEFKYKSIVSCNKCKASVGYYQTSKRAVEAWNRRVTNE